MRKRNEVRIVKRGDHYLILDKDDDTFIPRTLSDEARAKISKANKGRRIKHDKKTIDKLSKSISKANNTTGYYRVCKYRDDRCKQGFIYQYNCRVGGVRKTFASVDLKKLEAKVVAAGYEWKKL